MGDGVDVKVKAKRGQDGPFSFGTGLVNQLVVDAATGFVLDVEDTHFNTDRSVLLPEPSSVDGTAPVLDERRVTGLGVLHAALAHADKHSSQRLFVTGHTDPSGASAYNQTLSEKRAQNVSLLLRGKRDDWRKLSNKEDNVDDIQTILKWQNARAGWDCDPGPVNNQMNGRTRTAIGRFQERYNQEVQAAADAGTDTPFKAKIGVDKKVGEATWGAFYDVYMSELMDLLELGQFSELEQRQQKLQAPDGLPHFVGCGEHIPFDPALRNVPESKEGGERKEGLVRDRSDRRVELLFFDPGEQVKLECHPKPGQCKPQLCPLYKKQEFTFDPIEIPKGLELMEANLRLSYVDPEGKVRPFPEGLEVELKFGDPKDFVPELVDPQVVLLDDFFGDEPEPPPPPPPPPPGPGPDGEDTVDQEPNEKTGPTGAIRFVIPRKAKTCFLRFAPGEERRYISAHATKLEDRKLVTLAEAKEAVKDGRHYFALPREFTTLDAFWKAPDDVKFDQGMFLGIDDRATRIGSRDAPAELKLEIAWQFFRFEYFDRWTSSTTSVPQARAGGGTEGTPQVLELLGRSREFQGSPHAASAWTSGKGATVTHCLGWVHRAKEDDGTLREVPDDQCLAQFVLPRGVFVHTPGDGKSAEAARALVKLDAAPPGDVNRLRFYDLPTRWRSVGYPARLAGQGIDQTQPFQAIGAKKSTLTRPYLISLDVIVLANDSGLGPLHDAKWDDKDYRYGIYDSQLRLYKPDAGSGETYFTEHAKLKKAPQGAVVVEFPQHTRLIARGEKLYEVFEHRTSDFGGSQGFPMGARAAQRHANPNVVLNASKAEYLYNLIKPNGSTGLHHAFGQGAAILLRFCGHEGGVELFSVLQYCVVFFDFKPPKNNKDGNEVLAPAPEGKPAVDKAAECLKLVESRWNGRDESPRAEVVYRVGKPEKARGKWKAVFVRGGPPTGAHRLIHLSIYKKLKKSAFMWIDPSSKDPIGTWELKHLRPDPALDNAFTGAHELGHALAMPDEYVEKRDEPCLGQPNIIEISRSPGTPYGFDEDAMMVHERKVRTRYFWHLACWFREGDTHFTGLDDIVVERGTDRFTTRMTPRLGNAVAYPAVAETNVFVGKKPLGFLDRFLYVTGRDGWTGSVLRGAPFDGMIALRVKMAFDFTGTKDFRTQASLLSRAHRAIHDAFNLDRKVVARGTFQGKQVRLRVLFSPRYVSRTFPEGTGAKEYLEGLEGKPTTKERYDARVQGQAGSTAGSAGNPGVHANVRVVEEGEPGVRPGGNPREAVVRLDESGLFGSAHFDDDVVRVFGQLLGLPGEGDTPDEFAPALAALAGLQVAGMDFA